MVYITLLWQAFYLYVYSLLLYYDKFPTIKYDLYHFIMTSFLPLSMVYITYNDKVPTFKYGLC